MESSGRVTRATEKRKKKEKREKEQRERLMEQWTNLDGRAPEKNDILTDGQGKIKIDPDFVNLFEETDLKPYIVSVWSCIQEEQSTHSDNQESNDFQENEGSQTGDVEVDEGHRANLDIADDSSDDENFQIRNLEREIFEIEVRQTLLAEKLKFVKEKQARRRLSKENDEKTTFQIEQIKSEQVIYAGPSDELKDRDVVDEPIQVWELYAVEYVKDCEPTNQDENFNEMQHNSVVVEQSYVINGPPVLVYSFPAMPTRGFEQRCEAEQEQLEGCEQSTTATPVPEQNKTSK